MEIAKMTSIFESGKTGLLTNCRPVSVLWREVFEWKEFPVSKTAWFQRG